jgi:hypothetical protein
MESIYDSMFPSLGMSDTIDPEGIPNEQELTSQALTHDNDHLNYDQPDDPSKSDYFSQSYANGIPDHLQTNRSNDYGQQQDQTLQQQPQQYEAQQPDNQANNQANNQTEDAEFWFVDRRLPAEQQLQHYQQKLDTVKEYLQSAAYETEVQSITNQMLDEASKEIQDFKVVYQALKTNPQDFLLQYMPDVLVQYGISPVMSQEQIAERVQQDLSAQFGENYQLQVSPNEMFTPGSFTSMVYQTQQQAYQKYIQINAENQALVENWNQMVANGEINTQQNQQLQQNQTLQQTTPTPEEYANAYYETGMNQYIDEDSYIEFVQKAAQHEFNTIEAHKIVYFNDYLSDAYQQGLEQGRQAMYAQIKNSANSQRMQPPMPSSYSREQQPDSSLHRILANGGIPMY